MIRLGVAGRILGRVGLRAQAKRHADQVPHLSIKLLLVREVLLYLAHQQISCYRLPDDLVPIEESHYLASFEQQLDECSDLLHELGALVRVQQQRLTMHLGMHIGLSTRDEESAARSITEITAQARLLGALGASADSVLVLHIGGMYEDRQAALHQFATRFERLTEAARDRVVVELDQGCFSLPDLLRLHQMTGVPVVLDTLHLQLNNPQHIPLSEALGLALATWPLGRRPKIHFSSQRTEAHLLPGRRGRAQRVLAPRHGQHADFINPFEFATFVAAARGLPPFDVMLEAKAGDLALLRLREDLCRFAPAAAAAVQ